MDETKPSKVNFEDRSPVLKVIGMGGGGSNAVNRMIELGLSGVEFIVANTDQQALEASLAPTKIQLGPNLTRGLGAGGRPEIGLKAAEESRAALHEALAGADMVFLAAGMGGGTGTGSIAVATQVAKESGAVTIAVVTTPFEFEMSKRKQNAMEGIAALRPHADTLIEIPNDKLLTDEYKHLPLEVTFRLADDVLRQAVQGIAELVTQPGLINVDFAHIREMMLHGRGALMSIGHSQGENRAEKALKNALHHPLLEDFSLENAGAIVANFSGSQLSLHDVVESVEYARNLAHKELDVVWGYSEYEHMEDRAQVILVVTGLGAQTLEETMAKLPTKPARVKHNIDPVFEDEWADEAMLPLPSLSDSLFNIPAPNVPAPANLNDNLDVPAFLRKKLRQPTNSQTDPRGHYHE
jgi:cell division protein FtsZ